VDFEGAREELVELLDFTRSAAGGGQVGGGDGVAGPLRGAAAMQVLRHVYNAVDADRNGAISKHALLAACRAQPQVRFYSTT